MSMSTNLVPIALFVSLAFVIVGLAKILSDGRTRRRLIEANATPELTAAIVAPPQGDAALYGSLKWGLVIGAIGIALIIIQFLPYQPDEPIVLGLILLFGAVGLLGYYATARRLASRRA